MSTDASPIGHSCIPEVDLKATFCLSTSQRSGETECSIHNAADASKNIVQVYGAFFAISMKIRVGLGAWVPGGSWASTKSTDYHRLWPTENHEID